MRRKTVEKFYRNFKPSRVPSRWVSKRLPGKKVLLCQINYLGTVTRCIDVISSRTYNRNDCIFLATVNFQNANVRCAHFDDHIHTNTTSCRMKKMIDF